MLRIRWRASGLQTIEAEMVCGSELRNTCRMSDWGRILTPDAVQCLRWSFSSEAARGAARCSRRPHPRVDERATGARLHAHRRDPRRHRTLHRPAAARRVCDVRLVAPSCRGGGFRYGRDLFQRPFAHGADRERKIHGAGRHADLADGLPASLSADFQTGLSRGFSFSYGAGRLSHRRGHSSRRGHASGHAWRRRQFPQNAHPA